MSITKSMVAAAALAMIAGSASAEMKVYPYHSKENYCPAGLQPVTMSGVICCGTPNTKQSYQSVMAHPTPKKKHHKKTHSHVHKTHGSNTCPEGTKGCY
ncbi:MAG: hypothetical protein AB8B82_16655 [Roseovarius sp.]